MTKNNETEPAVNDSETNATIYDDLKRLGWTCGLIFRFWTSPMTDAPQDLLPNKEQKESFRLSAIAIIAFLFFALRPDLKTQFGPAVIGLGLTVCVAFFADFLMAYKVKLTDQFIIGSYSYLACTMLVFICMFYGELPFSLSSDNKEFICDYLYAEQTDCIQAKPIFYGFFTFAFCALVVILKSKFVDKNKNIGFKSTTRTLFVTFIFTSLIVLIYLLPNWVFENVSG